MSQIPARGQRLYSDADVSNRALPFGERPVLF